MGITVQIEMIDIKVRPNWDLTKSKNRLILLNKIRKGHYFAILISPPCSTFTRATWANKRGPRPIRSFRQPRGLQRLRWTERQKAKWGNEMADFSFEVCGETTEDETMLLFENPEDLGAVKQGELYGQRPASMWQWPQFLKLLEQRQWSTVAFYQQDFGTEYLKPTRLLLKGFPLQHPAFALGLPSFDDQGFYLGPLIQRTSTKPLIGHAGQYFTTKGTEQWPSSLCRWIAHQILLNFAESAAVASGGGCLDAEPTSTTTAAEEYLVTSPEGWKLRGGTGEPRICRTPGKIREFHDGAGLASPGRWDLECRTWNQQQFWTNLRERSLQLVLDSCGGPQNLDLECFQMAAKGEKGCSIVRNQMLQSKLVELWMSLLKEEGCDVNGLDEITPGQPFRLKLMQALLERAGDTDHKFLLQGQEGFPVGVIHKLPRTPHMYEEQSAWKLEDDPYMREEIWRENYESVKDHEEYVREHFKTECEEGLMERMTLEEAKRRYGERIAISSLSVLVEESHGNKKRIIHDATHGTKINNRIKCRDKQRSPGAREKMYLLAYYKERGCVIFSLVGDISKAHRRFLHHPSERGLLACRVLTTDDHVYINKVGTFGVASASYWWGRIAGSGLRLVHEMLGPEMPVELLIFADDLEALGPGKQGRRGTVLSFLYLATFGFPFKWAKQRGGLKVEWIGLFADYTSMRLGLSPSRAEWVAKWTDGLATSGAVTAKEMEQGLGRLCFAANALLWERPFLGPLFAWTAAIRTKKGKLKLPAMLRTILFFLAQRVREGGSLQDPPPLQRAPQPDVTFFTDAKATDSGAWIGGFLESKDGQILSWFSEKIEVEWAPWLFVRNNPKRVIASLELLATLVAVRLWTEGLGHPGLGTCWIRAGTDNQGNTYAVNKLMSTKFPLTLLVLELSETLRRRGCELNLEWIPREFNQLADDLTNEDFTKFPMDRRVKGVGGDTKWYVLDQLMSKSNEFFSELQKAKLEIKGVKRKRSPKEKKKLEPW